MALQDLIDSDLTVDNQKIKAYSKSILSGIASGAQLFAEDRLKTPKPAKKSLKEVYELIKQMIDHVETRARTPESNKITFTEEGIDQATQTEVLTVSCIAREPGSFSQGAPFEGKVKNQRPLFREELEDSENPGYNVLVTGYFYDNIIRLTCWAKTNKQANTRADWLEDVMEEYSWFFKAQGVDRLLFFGRKEDIVVDVSNQRWYGRPLDFYVRTEKIRNFSQKNIEEIIVNYTAKLTL